MDRPHLRRRGAAALAVALLAAPAQLALAAPAGADSSPAVTTAEPVVTGPAVTLGFTVNRAEHAIASTDCTLTGADAVTVSCGAAAPGAVRKSTGYTTAIADLAPGDYAYAVTVTLTDGGTATAEVPFTVEEPEPVEFAASVGACGALTGSTFVAHTYWWQLWACEFDAVSQGAADAASAVLSPLCLADGGYALAGGFVSAGRYELNCFTF